MKNENIDLTVATNVLLYDSIGKQGIGLIQTLYDDLSINTLKFEPQLFHGITDARLMSILLKPLNEYGKVCFWTYILGLNENIIKSHEAIKSPIKIAYSMFESDAIPPLWTKILNKYYDMVVVPDPWLVSVYRSSGVTIPIFVLPLGIMLKPEWFEKSYPKNKVFTFGMTAGFWERKNHIKTMQAFADTFGNSADVRLKIHGRFGSYRDKVEAYHRHLNLPNIELVSGMLSQEDYAKFMESIDCCVFISKGEGFSIIPRECLALQKPCILSNNTVHQTICQTNFVLPIKSDKKVPAYYEVFHKNIGSFYDVDIQDVALAMKEVYHNYDKYQEKTKGGREWTKQFLWSELKPRYLSLVRPNSIEFGETNEIFADRLQTNSKPLYHKYKKVFGI